LQEKDGRQIIDRNPDPTHFDNRDRAQFSEYFSHTSRKHPVLPTTRQNSSGYTR
jgi:hypothetical protein